MAEAGGGPRGPCAVCGLECVLACAKCSAVFYCGAAHQREHWPQHRKRCVCFERRSSAALGRHLVATKNISKGTYIIKEKALVAYPPVHPVESSAKSTSCPNCCVRVKSLFALRWHCRACLLPLCAATCLEAMGARGLHSAAECALLRQAHADRPPPMPGLPAFPFVYMVGVIRCLLLTGEKEQFFRTLESHSQLEELKTKPEFWNSLKLKLSDVDFAFGALNTNAFEYEFRTWNIECSVLLGNISFCAHSCVPNARMVPFMKQKGEFCGALVAIQDIPAGGVIAISYVEPFLPNHIRIIKLASDKKFRCRCPRCMDPTELGTNYTSICCSPCQKSQRLSILVPESQGLGALCRCKTCEFQMTHSEMVDYIQSIFETEKATGIATSFDSAIHESFLQRHVYPNGLLTKNVAVVVYVKRKLVYSIYGHSAGNLLTEMTMDQLDRKLTLCRELLDVVEVFCPGFSKERGTLLIELVGTLAEKARRAISSHQQEAQAYVEEAEGFLADIQAILVEPDKQEDVRMLCKDVKNVRKNFTSVE